MEPELEKKKTVAPPVEEQTPEAEIEIEPLVEVPQISKKAKAMAKSLGIDLNGITDLAERLNSFHESVELRFKMIQEALPGQIQTAMSNVIEQQQRKQMEMLKNAAPQLANNPGSPGGGFNLGSIMPLISMIAGGGGQDSEMQQMVKDMMSLNIKRMQADLDFTDSVKNAIVSKIAGKAAASLGEI